MSFDANNENIDWEEAFEYRPGQKVELKAQPGTFDTIASYEAMMVPPIWLVNDPKPRYAHELRLISHPVIEVTFSLLNRLRGLTGERVNSKEPTVRMQTFTQQIDTQIANPDDYKASRR